MLIEAMGAMDDEARGCADPPNGTTPLAFVERDHTTEPTTAATTTMQAITIPAIGPPPRELCSRCAVTDAGGGGGGSTLVTAPADTFCTLTLERSVPSDEAAVTSVAVKFPCTILAFKLAVSCL